METIITLKNMNSTCFRVLLKKFFFLKNKKTNKYMLQSHINLMIINFLDIIINPSHHLLRQLSIFSQLADHTEAIGVTTTVMVELQGLRDGLCQCHLWSPQMSIELEAFAGFYCGWTLERKSSIYSRKRIDGECLGCFGENTSRAPYIVCDSFLALVFVLKRYILNFLDILSVSL